MVNIVCLLSTTSSQTVREMIKFSRNVPKRNPEALCLLATLVAGIHCAPARTCGSVAGDALGWGRRRLNGWWRGGLVWVLVAGRIQHRSERSWTKGERIPEAASRG